MVTGTGAGRQAGGVAVAAESLPGADSSYCVERPFLTRDNKSGSFPVWV
jgi:hypothetical protein